jgi:hypothetical protein
VDWARAVAPGVGRIATAAGVGSAAVPVSADDADLAATKSPKSPKSSSSMAAGLARWRFAIAAPRGPLVPVVLCALVVLEAGGGTGVTLGGRVETKLFVEMVAEAPVASRLVDPADSAELCGAARAPSYVF